MSFLFDVVILIAAIVTVVLGVKRGFIKSVMGVGTLIAALFLAYAFTPAVSVRIEETAFVQDISENISDTIKSLSRNESDSYNILKLFDEMPDAFRQILDRYGANEESLKDSVKPSVNAQEEDVADLADRIADPVVKAISGVLAFLALFVGAILVLKILTWILDLIFQLPVLKTANKLLGFVAGLVSALGLTWVLSNLAVIFIRAMSSISPQYFNESLIDSTIIIRLFAGDTVANLIRSVIH